MSTAWAATGRRYIEAGCFVRSLSRGYEGVHDDGTTQVAPVNGLVVDVIDVPDAETGEVERTFVVVEPWAGRVRLRRIPESDVDRDSMEAAGPGQIARVVRQLCEAVALTDRRRLRTGTFTPEHITMLNYAHRLAGLL
jgi:hypothetical protein